MNTHSKWADCRREIFCAHAAICGGGEQVCRELMDAATTDACFSVLDAAGLRRRVLDSMLPAIQMHLNRRSAGHLKIGAVLFSNVDWIGVENSLKAGFRAVAAGLLVLFAFGFPLIGMVYGVTL